MIETFLLLAVVFVFGVLLGCCIVGFLMTLVDMYRDRFEHDEGWDD